MYTHTQMKGTNIHVYSLIPRPSQALLLHVVSLYLDCLTANRLMYTCSRKPKHNDFQVCMVTPQYHITTDEDGVQNHPLQMMHYGHPSNSRIITINLLTTHWRHTPTPDIHTWKLQVCTKEQICTIKRSQNCASYYQKVGSRSYQLEIGNLLQYMAIMVVFVHTSSLLCCMMMTGAFSRNLGKNVSNFNREPSFHLSGSQLRSHWEASERKLLTDYFTVFCKVFH